MSYEQLSVRDWSGILCEPCGSGERELGAGRDFVSGVEMERAKI